MYTGIPLDSATQCRHPEYQSYESRLSSFTGWPSHMSQTPESLADAGLFYIGKIFQYFFYLFNVHVCCVDDDNIKFLKMLKYVFTLTSLLLVQI
jgi:hypothetical protein